MVTEKKQHALNMGSYQLEFEDLCHGHIRRLGITNKWTSDDNNDDIELSNNIIYSVLLIRMKKY